MTGPAETTAAASELYKVLAGILTPAIALAGVWITQRAGRRTSESGQALQAWKDLLTPIREELDDVGRDLAETQRQLAVTRADLDRERTWRALATQWIGQLVKTHPNPPPAPHGFHLEDGFQ